jgi:hypothetical protein
MSACNGELRLRHVRGPGQVLVSTRANSRYHTVVPHVVVKLLGGIYPSPQTAIPSSENQTSAQCSTWAVEVELDGRLVEKTTGAGVTYVYWEAT